MSPSAQHGLSWEALEESTEAGVRSWDLGLGPAIPYLGVPGGPCSPWASLVPYVQAVAAAVRQPRSLHLSGSVVGTNVPRPCACQAPTQPGCPVSSGWGMHFCHKDCVSQTRFPSIFSFPCGLLSLSLRVIAGASQRTKRSSSSAETRRYSPALGWPGADLP